MAVPLDQKLEALPPERPLAMPVQDLRHWQGGPAPLQNLKRVTVARLLVFAGSAAITATGTYGMYQVISPANITWLQMLFATLFALTFAWISFSCASACFGFLLLLLNKHYAPQLAALEDTGRTALLMPVYNEDPERVFATLERMGRALQADNAGSRFDIFILSDTRKEDVAKRELICFEALQKSFAGKMAVYYRRRDQNHHRKAGNIADFVTRWGGAYAHMIVLDADSDMSADTLITLARAMAADPSSGIIQTLPLLRNRWTPYARMMQFAGRVYGPVIAAGLSAWHGRDGNYWGHNAIIRTEAFAEAAGLPELPGRKPFGGHILSHDFIEAALIRRAGYAVYMLPDLGGSYEETPPSLIDLAARDRRWAQGNLQHMKIVTAKGLHWASRMHLIQGIMSYLASPLWLALLLTGLGLATVARYTKPNYFPDGFSLFPAWPVFDPELALRLLGVTAFVLYLPKVLGVIIALRDPQMRKGCGGAFGLIKSFIAEIFLSMVLSPIMMMIQSRFVMDIFLGRDSGWNTQNRDEQAAPFRELAAKHAVHVLFGLGFGALAFMISWATFFWFLPIMGGLALAPVISWATGLPALGRWLWRANLFRIPEEQETAANSQIKAEAAGALLQPAE